MVLASTGLPPIPVLLLDRVVLLPKKATRRPTDRTTS